MKHVLPQSINDVSIINSLKHSLKSVVISLVMTRTNTSNLRVNKK